MVRLHAAVVVFERWCRLVLVVGMTNEINKEDTQRSALTHTSKAKGHTGIPGTRYYTHLTCQARQEHHVVPDVHIYHVYLPGYQVHTISYENNTTAVQIIAPSTPAAVHIYSCTTYTRYAGTTYQVAGTVPGTR